MIVILNFLKKLNEFLGDYSNIFSITGVIISVIALIISIIAFKISQLKPDLHLEYNVNHTSKWFKDKNGEIVFAKNRLENQDSQRGWGMVTDCIPMSQLNIIIGNQGNVPAKNPILNFKFINMEMYFCEKYYEDWKGTILISDGCLWKEIRWEPKNNCVIHPGIPITIENFPFMNSNVYKENAYVEVTLSAENMKLKQFKIPVKLIE